MRLRLRLAMMAAAGAAAIPGIAAPSATAQSVVKCQFTGTAVTSGVGVLPNTGPYSFTQLTFPCEGVAGGGAYSGAAQLNITTGGTFSNIVCGTGTFDSASGSVIATPIAGNLDQAFNGGSVAYHIQLVAGEGTVAGLGNGPGGTFEIVGTMSMVPTGGGDTPNTTYCTDNFEFASDLTFLAT